VGAEAGAGAGAALVGCEPQLPLALPPHSTPSPTLLVFPSPLSLNSLRPGCSHRGTTSASASAGTSEAGAPSLVPRPHSAPSGPLEKRQGAAVPGWAPPVYLELLWALPHGADCRGRGEGEREGGERGQWGREGGALSQQGLMQLAVGQLFVYRDPDLCGWGPQGGLRLPPRMGKASGSNEGGAGRGAGGGFQWGCSGGCIRGRCGGRGGGGGCG